MKNIDYQDKEIDEENDDDSERWEMMREFIIENKGVIKTKVIGHMSKEGKSSTQTTHNLFKRKIKEGTLIVVPDPRNRRIHHLYISDDYSDIKTQLKKISTSIHSMYDSMHRWNQLGQDRANRASKFEHASYAQHFIGPYIESTHTMLLLLLIRLDKIHISKQDKHTLYEEIMSLVQKLLAQVYEVDNSKNLLERTQKELTKTKKDLDSDKGIKRDILKEVSVNKIIESIASFQNEFSKVK